MKAVVCYGDGVVKYDKVPEPEMRPDEVKIAVRACGICGSDIPRVMARGAHSYPIILGHEFAGEIAELGAEVNRTAFAAGGKMLSVGDRVTAAPLIPCHTCPSCRQGHYSLCEHYSFIGSRQPGAMAEYVTVPAANVVILPAGVTWRQGALFEPSTVSLHALRLTDFQPGKSVAVLGGGTMGIFALQWARILGASKVVVLGRDRKHLELPARLGADAVISTLTPDYLQQAMDLTDGRGYDYVFEAAGAVETLKLSFALAAKRARVCMIGTPTREMCFSVRAWEQLNRKEMYVTGSWMSYSAPFPGEEWRMTGEQLASGAMQTPVEMFAGIYPMQEAAQAFERFRDRSNVKGRILLENS